MEQGLDSAGYGRVGKVRRRAKAGSHSPLSGARQRGLHGWGLHSNSNSKVQPGVENNLQFGTPWLRIG